MDEYFVFNGSPSVGTFEPCPIFQDYKFCCNKGITISNSFSQITDVSSQGTGNVDQSSAARCGHDEDGVGAGQGEAWRTRRA